MIGRLVVVLWLLLPSVDQVDGDGDGDSDGDGVGNGGGG
jgi:hypothetical protein